MASLVYEFHTYYRVEKMTYDQVLVEWEEKRFNTLEEAIECFIKWIKEEKVVKCHAYYYDRYSLPHDVLTYQKPKEMYLSNVEK